MRIFETEFFGQHQRAPGIQPLVNLIQNSLAFIGGQKLNGKVQYHHGGVVDGDITNIAFHNLDGRRRFIGIDVATAAFDHCRRVIHRHNFAARVGNVTPD